jgi:non-heme chloroperoxidase
MHGDDDQIVPIADSALISAKLVKNGILKVYKGYPQLPPASHRADARNLLLDFTSRLRNELRYNLRL